jgi:hypothetical protein
VRAHTETQKHTYYLYFVNKCRLHFLTRRTAAARLLGLRVRTSPRTWKFISFECCVWSVRSLCDARIPCHEESYRV